LTYKGNKAKFVELLTQHQERCKSPSNRAYRPRCF